MTWNCCKLTTNLWLCRTGLPLCLPPPDELSLAGRQQGADYISQGWAHGICWPSRTAGASISRARGAVYHIAVGLLFPSLFGEHCQLKSFLRLQMVLWPLARSLENKTKLHLFVLPALLKAKRARLAQHSLVSSSCPCASRGPVSTTLAGSPLRGSSREQCLTQSPKDTGVGTSACDENAIFLASACFGGCCWKPYPVVLHEED